MSHTCTGGCSQCTESAVRHAEWVRQLWLGASIAQRGGVIGEYFAAAAKAIRGMG